MEEQGWEENVYIEYFDHNWVVVEIDIDKKMDMEYHFHDGGRGMKNNGLYEMGPWLEFHKKYTFIET